MTLTPSWPALIKHHDEHELIYVASEQAWLQDAQLNRFPYANEDQLIDSQGQLFRPVYQRQSQQVELQPLLCSLPLQDFNLLLRKHMCTQNTCCISKLTVSSFAQGFALIASEDQGPDCR